MSFSQPGERWSWRPPTKPERAILQDLNADKPLGDLDWIETLLVSPLPDGSMGSLRLAPHGRDSAARRFGRRVAEQEYSDADGVLVLASLNVDKQGAPFEMDMWKVDFSPLVGPLRKIAQRPVWQRSRRSDK